MCATTTTTTTTHPTSQAPPTAKDSLLDTELRRTLNGLGVFESSPQRSARDKVLSSLRRRIQDWSVQLAAERSLAPVPVPGLTAHGGAPPAEHQQSHAAYSAVLLTFGSYHLQVHSPDADIDVLCLAPRHVTRADFFGRGGAGAAGLVGLLAADPHVTEMLAVPEAYTPVLKFKVGKISIDMLFASLPRHATLPLNPDVLVRAAAAAAEAAAAESAAAALEASANEGGAGAESAVAEAASAKRAAPDDDADAADAVASSDATAAASESAPKANPRGTSSALGGLLGGGHVVDAAFEKAMLDDRMLVGLDEASMRSLNGFRVTKTLTTLVPNPDHFRTTLRTVKVGGAVFVVMPVLAGCVYWCFSAFLTPMLWLNALFCCRTGLGSAARHLLQRPRFPRWHQLGYSRCFRLSALPIGPTRYAPRSLLSGFPPVGLAAADSAQIISQGASDVEQWVSSRRAGWGGGFAVAGVEPRSAPARPCAPHAHNHAGLSGDELVLQRGGASAAGAAPGGGARF